MSKYLIHIQYYEENTIGVSYGNSKEQAVYNFIEHIIKEEQASYNGVVNICYTNLPLFCYNEKTSLEDNINRYISKVLDFPITCIELDNKEDEVFYADYRYGENTNKFNKYYKR